MMLQVRVFFDYQSVKYGDLYWRSLNIAKDIERAKSTITHKSYDLNGTPFSDIEDVGSPNTYAGSRLSEYVRTVITVIFLA
jgi:hypothetical protein